MRNIVLLVATFLLLGVSQVFSDVYMHNPRGSNDKLDEANNNRNNANRLFDSQNNNNGGYNVGNLFYYQGSVLSVEWTAQHGANNGKVFNDFIIQYMCEEDSNGLRDGTTTNTIPDDPTESKRIEYGQHETFIYYQKCKTRERNKGLFTADQLNPQNTGTDAARFTRQNPNGNRYGFECPEERDYYPYWHPTAWKDLAIMTTDLDRCAWYQAESQNVKGKGECSDQRYNNPGACTTNGGTWSNVAPWGIAPPSCVPSCYARDNHLGNTIEGQFCSINITIPEVESKKCVLRLRYNISTDDFDNWAVDYRNNTQPAGESPLVAAVYPLGSGTVLWKDNQDVDIGIGVSLQMNVNTDQYFRTFQDRSHYFEIRKRPNELKGAFIQNLNVRGRRGNIVQVYPSVEYDFVPNRLDMYKNDYVHIQWTGSNTNPGGNDGEGTAGSDRHNLIESRYERSNYPKHLDNATIFDRNTMEVLAMTNPGQFGGSTDQLNDAGTYFNMDPIKLTNDGRWTYISTRNNNFSNRDQKGILSVSEKRRPGVTNVVTVRNALIGTSFAVIGLVAVVFVGVILFVVIHPPTRNAIFGKLLRRNNA